MAKSSYKISGVGQKQQIRNTVISGKGDAAVNWKLTLSGFDGADLLKGIEEGIDRANQIVAAELGLALDEALDAAVWAWRDGGARDIIDTGKLKASRKITVEGRRIDISYDVPYAGIVHFGGYILPYGNPNAEKVYLPARPWVDSVALGGGPVPKFDFERIYAETIEKVF
jgi:hypothetical protein